MYSVINLTTATDSPNDRARALEQFSATAMSLMKFGKNIHVSLSSRDYDETELIKEEPDYELLYNELQDKIHELALAWEAAPQKYRGLMASELREWTGVTR